MTFWVLPLEEKVPSAGKPWSLMAFPWLWWVPGPVPGGRHICHLHQTSENKLVGRDRSTSRHKTVQLRCRTGSRKHGMIIRGSLMKEAGVSGTLPWGDLDVSQSEASTGKLAQSHGDGRWEVREKAHQFILVVTILLVVPWKNQSFFTLITKVVNIYCRKHLL